MLTGFDEEVYDTLHAAQFAAARSRARRVEPEHVLFALLADDAAPAAELLRRAGADPGMARALVARVAARSPASPDDSDTPRSDHAPDYDRDVRRVLERAMALAHELKHNTIGDVHLVLALLGAPRRSGLARIFRRAPDSIARDALHASGLTVEAALAHVEALAPHDPPSPDSIHWRRRQS